MAGSFEGPERETTLLRTCSATCAQQVAFIKLAQHFLQYLFRVIRTGHYISGHDFYWPRLVAILFGLLRSSRLPRAGIPLVFPVPARNGLFRDLRECSCRGDRLFSL